jgi:hypothetical protein
MKTSRHENGMIRTKVSRSFANDHVREIKERKDASVRDLLFLAGGARMQNLETEQLFEFTDLLKICRFIKD